MLAPRMISCDEVMFFRAILQHPGRLCIILMRLQFFICIIMVGMVVSRVACFQYKWLDILVLRVTKCAAVEVADMSIEDNDLIVDSGSAIYGRELGHGFNQTMSIHIPILFVV